MNYTEHCNSAFFKGPLLRASLLSCSHNSVHKNQTQGKFGHNLIALGKKHGSDRSQMKKYKRGKKNAIPQNLLVSSFL